MKTLRWSIKQAAQEFGLDKNTVTSRIKSRGIVPGADGKFSTQQIHSAICGDSAAEKLRNEILDAEIKEQKLKAMKDREYLPFQSVELTWANAVIGIRQTILNSTIPKELQDELLSQCENLPIEEYLQIGKPSNGESE